MIRVMGALTSHARLTMLLVGSNVARKPSCAHVFCKQKSKPMSGNDHFISIYETSDRANEGTSTKKLMLFVIEDTALWYTK